MTSYELRPIGHVESPLVERERAPKQGFEGGPDAWLVFVPEVAEALRDLAVGDEVWVLTWLDRGKRDVLAVRPRDDPRNPVTGVVCGCASSQVHGLATAIDDFMCCLRAKASRSARIECFASTARKA